MSAVPTGPLPQTQPATAPAGPMTGRVRSSFSGAAIATAPATTAPAATVTASIPPASDVVAAIPDGTKLDIFSAVLDQIEAERPAITASGQVTTQTPPATTPQNGFVSSGSMPPPPVQQQDPSVQQSQATVLDQALPVAVAASTDTLNPAVPVGPAVAKERVAGSDQTAVEAAASIQYVEQEPSPEIPVEVETFIQRVTDHSQTAPHEVVIADGTQEQAKAAYPSRPVVVLPITQQVEEEGQKKSPKFSIRWLIEWSHKIIKMFAGKVIYRQVEAQ